MIAIIITTMITKIVIIMITPQWATSAWGQSGQSRKAKRSSQSLPDGNLMRISISIIATIALHCFVIIYCDEVAEPELSVKLLWKFTSFLNREQCYFCFGKKVRSNKTQKRTLCQCLLLIHNLSDLKGFKRHSYHLYWVWRHQFNGWTQNFQRKVKVQLSRFDRQQNLDLAKKIWSTQITAFGIFWV